VRAFTSSANNATKSLRAVQSVGDESVDHFLDIGDKATMLLGRRVLAG
jgi:hypothetical protein